MTVTCGLYYKPMTIVNEDSRVVNKLETSLTDNACTIVTCLQYRPLYSKTTLIAKAKFILANLPLVRSVNYDRKVRCKMNRS